jgi:phenylacetate-CoA ligase
MSSTYWNEKIELMPESAMKALQADMLKQQLKRVYERVPFYKELFDQHGVKPSDFRTLEDLNKFPFTVKSNLATNYPFGLCAIPILELARIHASSGTTGKPAPGLYAQEDVDQWTECMARGLWAQQVRPDTIMQNANGIGLFTGGLGFHQAAVRIGCVVLPTGTGLTERQLVLIQDFGVTALTCTASYFMTIIERAEKIGVDLRKTRLKTAHLGAEPWTNEMRSEILDRTGVRAYEHYGLTELMGPGVAFNCEHHRLHINEDHVYPEIIDPVTLEPLETGQQGELVFTALQRRAMPLVRYRTRDISTLRREKCACGRSLVVMEKVMGRTDDMLIISGVNVFPSQIESVLMEFRELESVYQIRVQRKGYKDSVTVETEVKRETFQAETCNPDQLAKAISSRMKQVMGIQIPVTMLPTDTIPRSQGKARRVLFDN